MEKVLAKGNPEKELHHHTNDVIKQAEKEINHLRSLGLNLTPEMEKAIKLSCFAHDLGKVSRAFQESLSGASRYVPHNLLSLAFLRSIFEAVNIPESLRSKIVYAVGFHHKNFLELNDFVSGTKRLGVNGLEDELIDIEANRLPLLEPMQQLFRDHFGAEIQFQIDYRIIDELRHIVIHLDPFDEELIYLKGILHRADHIASAGITEEPKVYLNFEAYVTLKKHITPKKFQQSVRDKGALLLVAPTGSGKTEAALCWAGTRKGKIIFTLPTRASVNAAFKRLRGYYGDDVSILHGEAGRFMYSTLKKELEDLEAIEEGIHEISLSRNLLKPVIVTTIDQIFSFALRVHQYEKVLVGLYGANVVVDEIDSYSPYTVEILKQSLKIAKQFRITPLIMSATIPDILREELLKEKIVTQECIPSWDDLEIKNDARHKVHIINEDIINCRKTIQRLSENERSSVLIVCNTIKKAVSLYEELKDLSPKLYHSLFTFDDREAKEIEISKTDQGDRNVGVWITTQVVEVSLDLDFDVLITEAAPVNALIQRMGRCYRRRRGAGKVFIYSKVLNESNAREFYPYGELAVKKSLEALKSVDGDMDAETKKRILNSYFSSYWNDKKVDEDRKRAQSIIGAFLSSDLTMLETIGNNEVSRFLRDSGISCNVIPISELTDADVRKLKGDYRWKDRSEKLAFLYHVRGKTLPVPLHSLLNLRPFFEETRHGIFITHLEYDSKKGLDLKRMPSNFG